QASYTSPVLATLSGQNQILVVSARSVMGVVPESGRMLWECRWTVPNDNAIAQPVILGTNRFLMSAGYGTGCTLFEITQSNGVYSGKALWHNLSLKNKFTSSVSADGYFYGLDEDLLTCVDAKTGERQWKDGNYGYGQLLWASGHLIILSAEGELALVKATPKEYVELAKFQALQGKTWNHLAISEGRLFVRNGVEMACYDVSLGKN